MNLFIPTHATLRALLCVSALLVPASAGAASPLAPHRTPAGAVFQYSAPDAKTVYLAGDFNDWAESSAGRILDSRYAMTRGPDGVWEKITPIEAFSAAYQFVVETKPGVLDWRKDPYAEWTDTAGHSVALLAPEGSAVRTWRSENLTVIHDSESGRACCFVSANVGGQRKFVCSVPIAATDTGADFKAEPLGPAAIALTWTRPDPTDRDIALAVHDNSAYFGTGERFNALNQKGFILPMASIDRPEAKGTVSYKPVPFFMSSRGYGLWIDNPTPGQIDFNATQRDNVVISYPVRSLRVVLFAGPRFADILREFTALTGRPPLPPAWSFAPWKSRDVHRSREEVLEDAELTRQHDLPGSVIVIDSPWETGYNDFRLNDEQFARPAAMFERLEQLGFQTCLWLTPFVNKRNKIDMPGIDPGPTSTYREALERGFLVQKPDRSPMLAHWWKGEGALVDFTNPKAVTWWHEQLDRTRQWGVRAFKCDDGEGNFISDAVFADHSTAAAMKNRYAYEYLKAMQAYIDTRLGGDGVLLARCGFTGTQKFPFCWCGDLETNLSFENGLPAAIIAGQTAALSGLSMWGHDIAGYIGEPTPEVFIRWTQFGAFSPLMQVHMTCNKGPWDFGDQALDVYRRYAKLHTQLYPYLRDAAIEASHTGMPIIRPMALAFQDDPQAANRIDQYLFGPDLLVAPIYRGSTRREVYLPVGVWIDYWTGQPTTGPAVIEADAPLDRIPLYVRAGAIIEMLPADVDTLVSANPALDKSVVPIDERRILQIWPGAESKLATSDGLTASVALRANQAELSVESSQIRPLEIWLMHSSANSLTSATLPPAAWKHAPVPTAMVVTIPKMSGAHRINWSLR